MNPRNIRLSAAILVVLLAGLACQFSFSTAEVENLRLAQDEAGQQATTQFNPGDTFYLVGDLSNAPDDTRLKAVWTVVAAEGVDPNTVIEERELTAPSGPFWFSLTQDTGAWPVGSYKVDLFLDDELNQSLGFLVTAPPAAQVEPTATVAPVAPTQAAAPTAPPASGPAGLSNIYTALDEEGQQPSSVFAQADKIYTIFTLEAGQDGASVRGALTATDVEGISPNTQITELEQAFPGGQNALWFESSRPWPKGVYRIDMALNGQPVQSLEVEVISTNTSGAVITEAYSALDEDGQQPAVTFPADSVVYIHFTLDSAPDDTNVKGVMVAADIEGEDPYTYVAEAGGAMSNGSYWFTFTNNGPWPVGSYVVYIYVSGELAGQLDFQVQ
jgi:hypothetical protein